MGGSKNNAIERAEMNKPRIGIVGLGWMGRWHAHNIMKDGRVELSDVCDSSSESIELLRTETGFDGATHSDLPSLLSADIDAVVIASPNALHADMTVAAAREGKHIYLEKPMAISVEDCRRSREAVNTSGVKFLSGYHRRLNPLYQHAKALVADDKLGDLFMIESDYIHHVPGDWDIWSWLGKESVAGSIYHAGSGHNVDLIRYFCGDIIEVSCMKGTFLPRTDQVETEDTAIALYRFESGAIGKVQCCVGPITPFQFNFRLYGTKGTVLNNRVWLDTIPDFAEPGHEDDCEILPREWIPDNVQGGVSETWGKLMAHFVDMLVDDVPCLNDVESTYKTSIACFAALEAARTGQVINVKAME